MLVLIKLFGRHQGISAKEGNRPVAYKKGMLMSVMTSQVDARMPLRIVLESMEK